uniref:Spondin-1 n=1 Tax=Photinus pyralis TaxID=7054 RepID=A0A1Y1JWI6_PHOPY
MATFKCLELVLIIGNLIATTNSLRCDRIPDGVTGSPSLPEDFFYIEISGNPTEYTPGETYTITVRARRDHRIKDFLLVVEHDISKKPVGDASYSVGTFQLRNMLTKFSDKCPNAVTNTNVIPKTEVEIDWKAPDGETGCVAFKLVIVESRDVWYNEGSSLVKRFCKEEKRNGDVQPYVLQHCCACDEAKYEVTFEGLWSRNTHPKDFPSDVWRTRFSDVIGASHTTDYHFWNYGELSSDGLREVAENASTRTLESELKAKSEHIRTIIKARGIGYPNVTGKTFAVFRVDNRHHLMSIVSMIYPSPDWFVGVSSLELCLENCSWVESMTLRLYPNDAGTDEGLTYDAPDQPTYPRGVIRKITSNSPNDDRSPFYDEQGIPIKPLAKLYLSRQRLYEKTCNQMYDYPEYGDENCEVTEWSAWTACSVTCGKGIKYRQRRYKNEGNQHSCRMRLTERASCRGLQKYCREDPNGADNEDPRCKLTDWGEWSTCSVTCGIGTKTRSRRYRNRNAAKRCAAGQENPPILEQNLECNGEGEDCEEGEAAEKEPDCPDYHWSSWTPCSSTCGKGVKVRYLLSLEEGDQRQFLMRQSRAHGAYDEYNVPGGDEEEDDEIRSTNNDCANRNPVEVVECYADDVPSCDELSITTEPVTDAPVLQPESNEIIDPDGEVQNCKVTPWSDWSPCNVTGACGHGFKEKYREVLIPAANGGKPCPLLSKTKKCRIKCKPGATDYSTFENLPSWPTVTTHTQGIYCEMSEWSAWSPCSQSCGAEAVQQRTRKIMRRVTGKGEPCSYRIDQKSCQLLACPLR